MIPIGILANTFLITVKIAAAIKDRSGFAGESAEPRLMEIAGSVRNGPFSPIETITCKPPKSLHSMPIDILGKGYPGPGATKLDPAVRERIFWCEVGPRS